MNNEQLLKELRDQLADIQVTMHDTVEPSVAQKLEEAIQDLDSAIESSNAETDYKALALKILGELLDHLPSIVWLFGLFLG